MGQRVGMHGTQVSAPTKASHGRFLTLDGMRGVAAIGVVWFHLGTMRWTHGPTLGFLAVDLFFLLSGFVLAHANDSRFLAGASATAFMKIRLVRLYPVYLVGFALGACSLIYDWRHGGSLAHTVIALASNLLLLPALGRHHFEQLQFPVDGPAWSLFLELWVANLLFAYGWRRLQGQVLVGLMGLAAFALMALTIRSGGLDGGASLADFPVGLARVLFSFFAGVVVARIHRTRPAPQVPSWVLLMLLVAVLVMPVPKLAQVTVELACVFLIFPALVYLGAGATARRPWLSKRLGDASYAAYAIHIPMLAGATWLLSRAHVPLGPVTSTAFIACVVAAALLLDRGFDSPVRRWLTERLALRPAIGEPGSGSRRA